MKHPSRQGAIVSQFKPVRAVLRQLIQSMDPEVTLFEQSSATRIEAMLHDHHLAFIFISLASMAEGGIEIVHQIKSNFPDITVAVMVRYDYPEYMAISKTMGIDHLISEENMDRQIIQSIVDNAKAGC